MKSVNIFLLFIVFSFSAKADFINLVRVDECETIIEVFVTEDLVTVRMEVGEEDYQWFSDIVPDTLLADGFSEGDKYERWSHFLRHQFILKSGNAILSGNVKLVDYQAGTSWAGISTEQSDTSLLKRKIIYVEIQYPLTKRIDELSITPPMLKDYEASPSNIGFLVYHNTVPVNDLRFLKKTGTLNLNWEDPWYSQFENAEISRHHKSSFMSFLYVEPYEVRHEILCRIKDLEGWIDLKYSMKDVIEVDEQDSLKELVANFLVDRNIVRIDGKQVKPIIDRIHFVQVNLSGIQVLEIPKPLPYSSAIIGVIFAYPHQGIPDEVTVHWDMFNDKVQKVPSTSIGPEGPWPYDLEPENNVMKWKNFLKHYSLPTVAEQKVEAAVIHVPLFTIIIVLMFLVLLFRNGWSVHGLSKWRKFLFVLYILLAILAYPFGFESKIPFFSKKSFVTSEARELFSQLLKNTYRAFDFREEGAVYDKLALSIDEDLLQQIYLQTRRSMVIENQGGIEARVNEVVVTKVEEEPIAGEGLAYRCNWIVSGEVGHWGHTHRRINQYDAIIKIRSVKGVWKIYDLDLIKEVRL